MDIIWKNIPGYEGRYQVSNSGAVKSFVSHHNVYSERERILRKSDCGYMTVNLTDVTGKVRIHYVHRLVAQTFIGEIPIKHEINHINGDKCDNRVTNLEIVTSSYNQKHAYATGLQKPQRNGARTISAIKNGHIVAIYSSINDMCRDMNLNRVSVWQVLNGKFSQHHGYTFSFTNH